MRLALGTAAVCLIGAVLIVVLPGTAAPLPVSCTVLEVTGHALLARTLPADTASAVGTLPGPVNAIGAVGPEGYGLTPAGHVVTFDRSGRHDDLGPVRAFPRIVDAAAGTVVGDRWYVRSGTRLFAIDVDAASPSYLRVLATVSLHPAPLAADLDDFDVNPASGSIYGVAQPDPLHGVVVRVDVVHGTLTTFGVTTPGGAGYGSASFGPDGDLYVRQDDSHGRSIRYRVRLSGGPVTTLSSGPALTSADATGCLPAPPPPPPTTTRPPPPTTTPPPNTTTPAPTTTTPPPTTTTTTPPAPIRPAAVIPPPTTTSVVPPPPSPAPVALPPPDDPQRALAASGTPELTVRKQQRQFGLSTLILVIGGGAAAARMRPSRGSNSNRTE